MRNIIGRLSFGRILAGVVMGCLTLSLVRLTTILGPTGQAPVIDFGVRVFVPAAAIAIILIAALPPSARTAWGRLCLMNAVVSLGLAGASVENGQPLWPVDPLYERALDEAMQSWGRHVIWSTAVYFATALSIAAVLFVLSYWLLHSRHGRHRQAN